MGFQNKIEHHEPPLKRLSKADEAAARKARTTMARHASELEELRTLRNDHSQMKAEIVDMKRGLETYKDNAADHARITKALPDLHRKVGDAEKDLKIASLGLEKVREDHSQILSKTKQVQSDYERISQSRSENATAHESEKRRLEKVTQEANDLEGLVKAGTGRASKDIADQTVEARATLARIRGNIAVSLKEETALKKGSEHRMKTKAQIDADTKRAAELTAQIDKLKKLAVTLNAAIESHNATIAKHKAVHEETMKGRELELDKRTADLTAREEALTKKKSWIREKWAELRSIKSDLERHHGRPLDHILIPELGQED